jgi:hypothetical protein
LRYRGHLTNISGNLFIGVNNAFALQPAGSGVDVRDAAGAPPVDLTHVTTDRPRLTETWFCCAEPTELQLTNLQLSPRVRGESSGSCC